MLKAEFIVFQVEEEHANDSHDLLFVEEVKDLGDILDDVETEVSESIHGELVVRQDPQSAANIVGDLSILEALSLQDFFEDLEAHSVDEDFGELIGLQQVHQAVSVALLGEDTVAVLMLDEVVEEVLGLLCASLVSPNFNKHGQHMGGKIPLIALLVLGVLLQERVEDVDAVLLDLWLLGLLDVLEVLDAGSQVLNDSIQESKGPVSQFIV